MVEKRRLTAAKTKISEVIGGKFFKQEGLEPNYVLTASGQRLSRVRILATVVEKFVSEDRKFFSVTLDDGSETIRAKAFSSLILDPVGVGDIIDVIGKVKEYNEEIYFIPEVVFKVTDPNLEILRELEIFDSQRDWQRKRDVILNYQKQVSDLTELKNLLKEFNISSEEIEMILQLPEQEEKTNSVEEKQKILDLIEKLDMGGGCDYSQLMEMSGLAENTLDSVIEELLEEGSCFEPRPGKIKKL